MNRRCTKDIPLCLIFLTWRFNITIAIPEYYAFQLTQVGDYLLQMIADETTNDTKVIVG